MSRSPHERGIIGRHWGATSLALATFVAIEGLTESPVFLSLGGALVAFLGAKVIKTVATEAGVDGDYDDRKA
jgi:hypothetical protein